VLEHNESYRQGLIMTEKTKNTSNQTTFQNEIVGFANSRDYPLAVLTCALATGATFSLFSLLHQPPPSSTHTTTTPLTSLADNNKGMMVRMSNAVVPVVSERVVEGAAAAASVSSSASSASLAHSIPVIYQVLTEQFEQACADEPSSTLKRKIVPVEDGVQFLKVPISFVLDALKRIGVKIIVVVTGQIGGRGVSYHDRKHDRILTDMFAAFPTQDGKWQAGTHAEAIMQSLGRLNTCVMRCFHILCFYSMLLLLKHNSLPIIFLLSLYFTSTGSKRSQNVVRNAQ
jgi:hypothetical protein